MTTDPRTRIGHVHLTVSDLDRALAFYRDVLGFEVTARYGPDAVFVSAGGYHHHIGLNTWAGRGVIDNGIALEGASDHGVSEAVYLRDPDGNGLELYHDKPENEWPRGPDGAIRMHTRPLDLEALLA